LREWPYRLSQLIQDWRFLIHRDGWKTAWHQMGQELISLPYRRIRFAVVARSLTQPVPDAHPKVPVQVRPFTTADLEFVYREHRPSEAHLCARRLERGHDGLAACIDGQVVGYAWSCTDASLERVDLRLAPGDVLLTDAFTAPSGRGQGVQTVLSVQRLHAAQEKGHRRTIAYIEIHNAPSLTVWQKKMGAQVIAHITFTRIGLWRKTTYVDNPQEEL
jgi:GNAT superfamily N-acetyltransferase